MGWFSKKDRVPELPTAPAVLPDLSSKPQEQELPDLPSFPVNPQTDTLNQEIVKSAVTDISSGENEDATGALEGLHVDEESDKFIIPKNIMSSIPELPKKSGVKGMRPSLEIPAPKKALELAPVLEDRITRQTEPIFVRIDKFQSAQKDFEIIKEKVKDIGLVLGKIKDVKSKEEQELNSWSEEIDKLKSRLAEIDSNVFSQM